MPPDSVIRFGIRRLRPVALVAALGTSTGCAPEGVNRQGTIVIALENDIGGFNELVSADNQTTQQVIERLYLDLFEEDPDSSTGPPHFTPRLAESYDVSEDGTVITVSLRADADWSDGTPITAEDVRWTWQAQTHPDVAWEYVDIKTAITDVEVVDAKTVRFHFARRYASQLADLNEGVVLPRHVWSQLPFERWREGEEWFRRHLVVSGPYQVRHYEPGAELALTANPGYYESDLPRIGEVVLQVVPDPTSRLRGLLAGDLDFIPKLQPHEARQVESSAGTRLIAYPHRQYDYIAWNLENPLLADGAVRRALTLAIDRQQIIDTLLEGYATLATSPIISSVWAHADLEPWPHDPQAASEALTEAGWSAGDDGVLVNASGQPLALELTFNGANIFRRDAAAMIQHDLRQIGVAVTLRPEEFHVLTERLENFEHQGYLGAFNMDTTLDLTVILHSDSVANGYNFAGFVDPEIDRLIERVKTYPDILDAGADLRRIQQILHQRQPMTFLWEPMRLDAHSSRLTNVRPNLIDSYANLRRWTLTSAAATGRN